MLSFSVMAQDGPNGVGSSSQVPYWYNASGWNIPSDGAGAPWAWSGVSSTVLPNTVYILTYVYDGDVVGTYKTKYLT